MDHEIADATAKVVGELLGGGATLRFDDGKRPLTPADIGVTSSHRVMNSALSSALGSWANQIRVDTPERWQGLERPVMIAVHPLSGVADPSAFDLETGRLCVMASRHQAGFIVLTRDHVGETLRNYVPSAEQAPGRPDTVGRGHDAHLKFWTQLEDAGSIVAAHLSFAAPHTFRTSHARHFETSGAGVKSRALSDSAVAITCVSADAMSASETGTSWRVAVPMS